MSYYESYLFEKREGLLDDQDLRAVNALSSHIEASRSHAFVTYRYGSFKYKPLEVLGKYFDTFQFYIPMCGGTLAYRFDYEAVDLEKLKSYQVENHISVHETVNGVILEISLFQEEPDYERDVEDFEDNRNPFSEFWEDTIHRDYRWLEILWIYAMNQSRTPEKLKNNKTIRPTLSSEKLSERHRLLADFFMESPDVITTIDQMTYREEVYAFDPHEWLDGLSRNEMMRIVKELIHNPHKAQQSLLSKIRATYEECGEPHKQSRPITFSDLQKLVQITREQRQHREQQKRDDEAHQFSKKIMHLEHALWDRVHTLIGEKRAASYRQAVTIMAGLQFAYYFHKKESAFLHLTNEITSRYSRLKLLHEQMTNANLLGASPSHADNQPSPNWDIFDI
jgi:hypothetical protein